MTDARPRYTERALPPYSYVPGHAPHPVSDPAGHMFGQEQEVPVALEPNCWRGCGEYLFGLDLFNHGYYWESHEAWESLWHVAGRKGKLADFLKGLIKLAAAGVKAREGNPRGVERHATRSQELLMSVGEAEFCGLSIEQLIEFGQELIEAAGEFDEARPELLLGIQFVL